MRRSLAGRYSLRSRRRCIAVSATTKFILATANRYGTAEITRRSGKAKPVVWR